MNISNARALLAEATAESDRIRRHLLVAAALGEMLNSSAIVVGGLAEDFYTDDLYQPTDLDVCAALTVDDEAQLLDMGFTREGRHWFHAGSKVAVEFPDARVDGDESRVLTIDFGLGRARMIGVDDLYFDRLRQATITESEGDISFIGALAVAAACFEDMDWRYIRDRVDHMVCTEPLIGKSMAKLNRIVRRRARAAIEERGQ